MLKKTITYKDYFDADRTEDVYFNLTKSELLEMETSQEGGFSGMMMRIAKAEKGDQIVKIFKDLLLTAYGERTDDGKYFRKTQELRDAFSQSAAYDALLMELVSDPEYAAEFFTGVFPADLIELAKQQGAIPDSGPKVPQDHKPKNLPTTNK